MTWLPALSLSLCFFSLSLSLLLSISHCISLSLSLSLSAPLALPYYIPYWTFSDPQVRAAARSKCPGYPLSLSVFISFSVSLSIFVSLSLYLSLFLSLSFSLFFSSSSFPVPYLTRLLQIRKCVHLTHYASAQKEKKKAAERFLISK